MRQVESSLCLKNRCLDANRMIDRDRMYRGYCRSFVSRRMPYARMMMERDVSFLGENVVMYECVFGVAILIKVNTVRRTSVGHKVTK